MSSIQSACVAPLNLHFMSPWHIGAAKTRGEWLDAVVMRDTDGLPYVPGRSLRGVLRDAAECLVAWGHWPEEALRRLFGESPTAAGGPGRVEQGALRVTDAVIPAEQRAALITQVDPQSRDSLLLITRTRTAMDPIRGVVKDQSLRTVEEVIPMTLCAEIGLEAPFDVLALHQERLASLMPLVLALGAGKTRGLGRVRFEFGAWKES